MGKTAADVQREIEALRGQTNLLVDELETRVRDATNVRSQIRRHPAIAAGVGIALLSGLAFAGYAVYERVQEEQKPAAHLRERAGEVRKALKQRGKERHRAMPVSVEERSDRGLLKRILYAAMTATMVALATFLARRAAETIWSRTMQERPPLEQQ